MDIITHTLSGVAIGTGVMSFSKKGFSEKLGIIFLSTFGGAFPDLDAISLWSGFDATIGNMFKLDHSGKEIYFSKFWYSHHAFLHSILAGLLITILIGISSYLLRSGHNKRSFNGLMNSLAKQKLILFGFLSGYIIHLLEDIPTPSCVWGGVNLLWPSGNYLGGTGDIWWWNNYDIFIIVILVILINLSLEALRRWIKFDPGKLTALVLISGLTLGIFQIRSRDFDFNYNGHTHRYNEFESKSKEVQKDILGDGLYDFMLSIDNRIPLNF